MMASEYIKFEGGSFLKSFIAGHESEVAFLEATNEKGYAHLFEDDKDRENKLRALYGKVSKMTSVVSSIDSESAEESPTPKGKKAKG
jgi:hypothetical protein